jgi:hypothetical protein
MSEAELHILRARLDGGIRNKAARGEPRRGLPVGFVWGEQDGEVRFQPYEAVVGAISTVFSKFTELGSARKAMADSVSNCDIDPSACGSGRLVGNEEVSREPNRQMEPGCSNFSIDGHSGATPMCHAQSAPLKENIDARPKQDQKSTSHPDDDALEGSQPTSSIVHRWPAIARPSAHIPYQRRERGDS